MSLIGRIREILHKKALHQTAFVMSGSLINGASLFAVNIILARTLSQELVGIFALATVALSTAAELSDFGLNSGLLRFGPFYLATKQESKLKQLLKTIWQWRVWLSVGLTVGGVLLSPVLARFVFGQNHIAPYLALAFLGVGGIILLGFLAAYLQATQRFVYHASMQSLKGFVRLVATVALMLLGVKNLYAYLGVYIAVPWLLFLINYRVLPAGFRQAIIDHEVKQQVHSQLGQFTFWLTVASLLSILSGRIDQVMISHYLGLEQVAVFAVAWQLIQFFPVIYGSITSVLTPKVNGLTDVAALKTLVRRTLKWTIIGALGVAVIIYPSQYLISFLFGDRYAVAMPIYLVLAYSLLLDVVAVPFSLAITAFNRTQIAAMAGLLQIFVIFACNLFFIPRFGIMGAAYAFAVSTMVQFMWNTAWAVYLLKYKAFVKL